MSETLTNQEAVSGPHWLPIVRPPLQEEVAARIRQMIDDGILMPGSRVPERQLCAQFGISRTPLREAFRVLAAEGLLEVQPRRGATIRKFPPEDIDHMFQVLAALEALAGELACDHMTDEQLSGIEALHRKMMSCFKRRDRQGFFETNQTVHERIVRAAANPVLTQVYEGLSGQILRIRYLAGSTDAQWAIATREHRAIMKALKARNKRALCAILRTHLETKRERVKSLLAKTTDPIAAHPRKRRT